MQIVQREFYRSARGPTPKDEDVWSLIFDSDTRRLVVRMNGRRGAIVGLTSSTLTSSWRRKVQSKRP